MDDTEEGYVPIEELADHLQVSKVTIRSWVKKGLLPENSYLKIGSRTYRFKISKIEEHFTPSDDEDSSDAPEQLELDFNEPERDERIQLDVSDDDEGEF